MARLKRKTKKKINWSLPDIVVNHPAPPTVNLYVGLLQVIDGIACVVKYVNAGKAWLTPVVDMGHPVSRHIAFATMTEYGEIKKL